MDLIKPDDAGYDEARTVFNSMIDKRPAVIAQCATPADVRDALQLATSEGYDVAVRAGGHSVAGVCLNDGGLVIDVRPMKDIQVDADAASGARGSGRHVGRVRPGHAGARPGHDRWTCVDDRCRRSDPRWRVGMDRAGVGPQLRQPRLGRSRDRRRPRGHGERGREPRSLLGAARRGRQLRCRHLVRVQAARAGPAGDRRPDAVARRCRRRCGAPVPRLRRRGARRAGHGPRVPDRSTGGVRAGPPPGHDGARHRRPVGR